MSVDEELLAREIVAQKQREADYVAAVKGGRRAIRLVSAEQRAATERMNKLNWPDSEIERVEVWRFLRRSTSKHIRLIQLLGDPFTGNLRDAWQSDAGTPRWLGEDGRLYGVNLMLFDRWAKPGMAPLAPLNGLRFEHHHGQELLEALRKLGT